MSDVITTQDRTEATMCPAQILTSHRQAINNYTIF